MDWIPEGLYFPENGNTLTGLCKEHHSALLNVEAVSILSATTLCI
jgi:hypothetical protein